MPKLCGGAETIEALESRIADLAEEIRKIQARAGEQMGQVEAKLKNVNVQKSKLRYEKFKTLFGFAGPLFKDFSPYLVLILLIVLLIGAAAVPKPKPSPGRKITMSWWEKLKRFIKMLLEKIFPVHTIRRLFNPFGKVDTIPRTQNAGRCDNAEWREYIDPSEPYGGGFCKKTYHPKPYVWNIDQNKLPDYDKLPDKMKRTITKDGKAMQVFIPYALQSTFYVPQCNDAYYIDQDAQGNEIEKKFSDEGMPLLQDKGLTCSLVEKDSNQANGNQPYKSRFRESVNNTAAKRDELIACTG